MGSGLYKIPDFTKNWLEQELDSYWLQPAPCSDDDDADSVYSLFHYLQVLAKHVGDELDQLRDEVDELTGRVDELEVNRRAIDTRDERNRWIYDQVCSMRPYRDILDELKTTKAQQHPSWPIRVGSPEGLRKAARKYAEKHGLEPPPLRKG